MRFIDEYQAAQHLEVVARERRRVALRALLATGAQQREIAAELGISQSAIKQQLGRASAAESVDAATLLEAATPILRTLAQTYGYSRLSVFGSLARGEAHEDSDIDLVIEPPEGTSSFEFVRFKLLIENVIGRDVDLITFGGLSETLDADIRREALLL